MLALPLADPEISKTGPKVFSSFTLHPEYIRRIDAAGCKFDEFYREKVLKYNKKDDSSDEEEKKTDEFSKDQINDWEKKRHKKNEQDVLKSKLLEENYYDILGLGDLGMGSSEGDIKKAYRKMALVYHPDKSSNEATNPMWLKMQKAYETLIDAEKKKKYDSTLPFDESIPEDPVEEEEFFGSFKPAFIKNSMWSIKKPVPDIGDMDTDIKKVYKFYEFWDKFDSWRDFSVYDEYNLDEAESRYERRYMEKENKRIKGEHLKNERSRIFRLVENAKKYDPRLIKIRKEEEEQKMKAKLERQQKKDQFKKDQADKEKKEEEARLNAQKQKEDEEKRIEDEKKKQKDDQRKAIRDLKQTFAEKIDSPKYDKFWLDGMIEKMKQEDHIWFREEIEKLPNKNNIAALESLIQDFEKTASDRKKNLHQQDKVKAKQQQEEDKKAKESQWTVEEMSLLSKAIVKFPAGTKNRWGCISAYVASKSADEVLQKTKEMSQSQSFKQTTQMVSKEAFSLLKNQQGTMKNIDAEPDKRAVFDEIGIVSRQAKESEEQKKEETKTDSTPKKSDNKESKDAKPTQAEETEWSQAQQQALEKALKEFPSTMEAQERWTKIAEKVQGKTKKQCVERFKELRNAVKGKTG